MYEYPRLMLPSGYTIGMRYVSNDGVFLSKEQKEQSMMLYTLDAQYADLLVKLCGRQFGNLQELTEQLMIFGKLYGLGVQN
jgi:hypothetical protein